jgi:hypothetical protein
MLPLCSADEECTAFYLLAAMILEEAQGMVPPLEPQYHLTLTAQLLNALTRSVIRESQRAEGPYDRQAVKLAQYLATVIRNSWEVQPWELGESATFREDVKSPYVTPPPQSPYCSDDLPL